MFITREHTMIETPQQEQKTECCNTSISSTMQATVQNKSFSCDLIASVVEGLEKNRVEQILVHEE